MVAVLTSEEVVVDANSGEPRARPSILLVEDDAALREAIADTLELANCEVGAVPSAEAALEIIEHQHFDMVVTDVNMGGMDGHSLLQAIRSSKPFLPVLLITAYGSIERSVNAIQSGAVDYLVKPFEPKVLVDLVRKYACGKSTSRSQPVAEASSSREMLAMAKRVAATDSTVLIAGESGVGKEVVARYVHDNSPRCDGPFVAINCAAIPDTMLEATLFGHEKGAFTGAHQMSIGKFEQANGGTLLLDEVSEMDVSLQAKLLRVLQEQEIERVGGKKTIALNVRIIATTNRNLKAHVERGEFREDLFYRLSVFPLNVQPLRERPDDVLPLAESLLVLHANKMGRVNVHYSNAAKQALLAYAWPGNVRELGNVVQRALILQSGQQIAATDLLFDSQPVEKRREFGAVTDAVDASVPASVGSHENSLGEDLRLREYRIILDALKKNNGSRKKVAETLGVSERTLRYKLAKMRELNMIE